MEPELESVISHRVQRAEISGQNASSPPQLGDGFQGDGFGSGYSYASISGLMSPLFAVLVSLFHRLHQIQSR